MPNKAEHNKIDVSRSEFHLYARERVVDELVNMLVTSARHIEYCCEEKSHYDLLKQTDYIKYVRNISEYVSFHNTSKNDDKDNAKHLFAIPVSELNFGLGHLFYNHIVPFYDFSGSNILVSKYLDEHNSFNFNFTSSSKYIEEFFRVLQVIFDPRIMNHNSDFSMRRSYIIYNLLQLGIYEEEVTHTSSIFAPFTFASLVQSIENYYYFRKYTERDALFNLREQLFFRKVKRNLIRHYKYSNTNETRRLKYDKEKSQLISLPYSKITSIEDIKPIRILEKITYHIQQRAETTNESIVSIKVGVIGNYSDYENHYYKIYDLIRSVCVWFSENYHNYNLKMEMLFLKQANDELTEKKFDIDVNNCEVTLILREDNFDKLDFQNNAFTLNNYIEKSDVLFLWDCPWLSEEQFDVEDRGSLESFSKMVSKTSYIEDFEKNYLYKCMDKKGIISKIDNQINRITSSNTVKEGTVTRIPIDYILDFMRECIRYKKELNEDKTIYVYFSTKNGINYSKYSRYIFLREELYGGKKMTILKFTTNSATKLSIRKKIHFEFDLWSIIKYTEISFALENLQHSVFKCIQNYEEPIDYIRVFKNTHIIFEPDMTNNSYNINVRYKIVCDDYLKQKLTKDWDVIINDFISCLLNKAVFSDSDVFGNKCIQNAFKVILYSHSDCLDNLYFYEKYKDCCNRKRLNCIFKPLYDENLTCSEQAKLFDTFSDKKLYAEIIEKSLWSDNFTFSMYSNLEYAKADAEGNYSFGEIANMLLFLSDKYGSITEKQNDNIKKMLGVENLA